MTSRAARPLTQPFQDEHFRFLPYIEALRAAADAVGEAPVERLRVAIEGAYAFLAHDLMPHAYAEDTVLYPFVARVLGSPAATATMTRDHAEVGRLIQELAPLREYLTEGTPTRAQEKDLRRILYGLYALVKAHFAKEEQVYLPLLEARLTPEEADTLFAEMERAGKDVRCWSSAPR